MCELPKTNWSTYRVEIVICKMYSLYMVDMIDQYFKSNIFFTSSVFTTAKHVPLISGKLVRVGVCGGGPLS